MLRLPALAAVVSLLLVATSLASGADLPRDWLEVRRGGAAAALRVANAAEGATTRALRYRPDVPKEHPDAGTRLELRFRAGKVGKGKEGARRTDLVVILRDSKGRVVAGAATDGDGIASRCAAATVTRELKALFSPCPGAPMPLAPLVALSLAGHYDSQLEGEFDGTAIVRLQPSYTRGAGLEPIKIGISKQFFTVTVSEIDDAKGEMQVRALWLDTKLIDGRVVAQRLRFRLVASDQPSDWILESERLGDKATGTTGAAALRGR